MLNVSPVNLLCTILNLLILVFLMRKFLYKPVLAVIVKRQEMIENQWKEVKEKEAEAEHLKEQYEACLLETKEEKAGILKEAKVLALKEQDRIIKEADKKAKQVIREAKEEGRREKAKVIKEAEAEIVDLAMAAAARILEEDGR